MVFDNGKPKYSEFKLYKFWETLTNTDAAKLWALKNDGYQLGYQHAIAYYGTDELLAKIDHCMETAGDFSLMVSREREKAILTAFCIQQLARNLDCGAIHSYLQFMRYSSSLVLSNNNLFTPPPLSTGLLEYFARSASPRFLMGDKLRWINSLDDSYWGVVIGKFFCFAPHLRDFCWCYLLWFNEERPDAADLPADIAWEEDLELWQPR